MEIKIKNYLINTLPKGNKVYICPMTEEEYKAFYKDLSGLSSQANVNRFTDKYGFRHTNVVLDGETYLNLNNKDEIESIRPILKHILPHPKWVKHYLTNNTVTQSYKCFCVETLGLDDVTEHRTEIESWNCLMIRLGEPQYAIVVEENYDSTKCDK